MKHYLNWHLQSTAVFEYMLFEVNNMFFTHRFFPPSFASSFTSKSISPNHHSDSTIKGTIGPRSLTSSSSALHTRLPPSPLLSSLSPARYAAPPNPFRSYRTCWTYRTYRNPCSAFRTCWTYCAFHTYRTYQTFRTYRNPHPRPFQVGLLAPP